MAFEPNTFQSGGSFVSNLSGFQRNTQQLGDFFAGQEIKKNVAATKKELIEQKAIDKDNAEAAREAEITYVSGAKNDAIETISRIGIESNGNIQGFNETVEGARLGFLSDVPEEYRGEVERVFDTLETSQRLSVMKLGNARGKQSRLAEIETTTDTFSTAIFNAARDGESVSELKAEAFLHLDQSVEAGIITATAAADRKRKITIEAQEQGLRHSLDKTYDVDGAATSLEDLDSIEQPSNWTPDQWDTFKRSVRADFSRKDSRADAETRKRFATATKAAKEYVSARGVGFDVSEEQTAEVFEMAEEFPELAKGLGIVEDSAAFATSSIEDRQTMIGVVQTGNLVDAPLFAALVSTNTKVNKMAQEDAYSLGVDQGIIDTVPLDLANIDPAVLEERVLQAESLSAHYGVEALPLTAPEIDALTQTLPEMTVPEKVQLANSLSVAPELWGEIAKKGGGTFAMAGATGDRNLMATVFRGEDLLANKLRVSPSPNDFLEEFTDQIGGIYLPEDAMNIKNAALAYYAATSDGGEYDQSTFDAAVEAVTGGIGEVNGFKVELPRGVDESDFEDFIDDMQPETIAILGGVAGMTNEEAAILIGRSRITNAKSGSYYIDSEFGRMTKPDGTPFIIEWTDEAFVLNNELFEVSNQAQREANIEFSNILGAN